MITQSIQAYFEHYPKEPRQTIGLSSIGHCQRSWWYKKKGYPESDRSYKDHMVLEDGNLGHDQIRRWIRKGLVASRSCYRLVDIEKEVEINGIKGHVDGILRHKYPCDDPNHVDQLLELKTMNAFGVKRFKEEGVSFYYKCQIMGYLKATGLLQCRIVVKNKDKSSILESVINYDDDLIQDRLDRFAALEESDPPVREYAPDEAGVLPWNCNYCPFLGSCWPDAKAIDNGRKHRLP